MEKWYEAAPTEKTTVLYSRVRLVRNWKEYPFPRTMTREQSLSMTDRLCDGLRSIGEADGTEYRLAYLDRMPELEKTSLSERSVINRSAAKKKEASVLLLSPDERVSITVNGDDHIRIQTVEAGLSPLACYERADRLDDYIGERFEYSFDEKYGYLTAFPTNVGTGLRVSAVLHLPMLSRRKNFSSLLSDMGRFGTLVRGVYGEGGENFGSLYQVSNQRTLGMTERDLIDLVRKTAAELDGQERKLRAEILKQRRLARTDEIYKSYGVLKYARRLTRKDAMEFLSQLMAGVTDGVICLKKPCSLYGLMLCVQPANLLMRAKRPLDKEELDAARADFLREHLPEIAEGDGV